VPEFSRARPEDRLLFPEEKEAKRLLFVWKSLCRTIVSLNRIKFFVSFFQKRIRPLSRTEKIHQPTSGPSMGKPHALL
jgi:hypothetical protein